ncbi:MAG: hypothetical protein K1060chlam5_01088 [Candidatus Anoxychlamydiales bacterium]|nr:hypothetical protein [Candidatus Anoxychlamydiales bacterium]
MVNYPGPIDPFERKKVSGVEEKQSKEESKKLKPKAVSKKIFLYLSFLSMVSKLLNYFTLNNNKSKYLEKTTFLKDLTALKKILENLSKKDLSQDGEFLNYFAYIWIKFLKDFENLDIENNEIKNKIKTFITSLETYPLNQEYNLGYYLSNLAGYKWVPFPYMEILKKIHFEHLKNPKNSFLNKRIKELNELI